MGVKLGSAAINALYLGATAINKAYLGPTVIFSAGGVLTPPTVHAATAYVFNADTSAVYYSKTGAADDMASTSKLATVSIIARDYADLSVTTTVVSGDLVGGSTMNLHLRRCGQPARPPERRSHSLRLRRGDGAGAQVGQRLRRQRRQRSDRRFRR